MKRTTTGEQIVGAMKRPSELVVSPILWTAGLSWLVPMLGTMTVLNQFVHPRRTEWLSRLYCRGQLLLTGSRWRAVVDPAVDPNVPYMFVQNHTNHLDHVTLYPATPHFKQGVELEDHFKYPFYGWFMKSRGTLSVKRGNGTSQLRDLIEQVRREVSQGHSIMGFPEGTRTLDGRVGAFKKGLFLIAKEAGVPVVPVSVTGMYRVMRKGSYAIHPGHQVTVYVDAPIETKGLSGRGITELTERVREVIRARVELR